MIALMENIVIGMMVCAKVYNIGKILLLTLVLIQILVNFNIKTSAHNKNVLCLFSFLIACESDEECENWSMSGDVCENGQCGK